MAKEHLIFGIYPILEAIKADVEIDKVYIQKGIQNKTIDEIVSKLEQLHTSINYVPV